MQIHQLTRVGNVDYSLYTEAEFEIEDILNARNTARVAFSDQTELMPSFAPALLDSSANAHDGSYLGGSSSVSGALDADTDRATFWTGPSGQYGSVPNHADLQLATSSGAFSIEYWVKIPSFAADGGGNQRMLAKFDDANNSWNLSIEGSGGLIVGLKYLATVYSVSATENFLTLNTWAHVVVTFTGTVVVLSVNGRVTATTTSAPGLGAAPADLLFGRLSAGASTARLTGALDEVAYYPDVLTSIEILTHYAAAAGINTNYALRSQEFNHASWLKVRSSVVTDSTTAPDGTQTADTLVEDTSVSNSHYVFNNDLAGTPGATYTLSVYAKPKERSQIKLQLREPVAFADLFEAVFDVTTGIVLSMNQGGTGSVIGATITNEGSGWFRCTVTGIYSTSVAIVEPAVVLAVGGTAVYTGDGVSGLYIWGAQLEIAPMVGRYIPNTSSSPKTLGTYAAEVLATAPKGYWRLGEQAVSPAVGQAVEMLHGVELWAATWTQSGLNAFTAAFVNDGNTILAAFNFNAAGVGSYLKLDLGTGISRAFRSVRLYASGIYTAILNVEYSDDDAAWTPAITSWNAGNDGAYSSNQWAAVGAHRYWRLLKTNAAAAGGSIYEVQFSIEPLMVLFAGTIDQMEFSKSRTGGQRRIVCDLVDWNQLCDRRLVPKEYLNQSSGAIVNDLITNFLAADGVVPSSFVDVGPLVTKFVANYLTVRQVLDDLAELIGYGWYIDYDRRLHWFPMETHTAPFTLDGTTLLHAKLHKRTTRAQYRNVQYVRAGKDLTSAQVEAFRGDGSKRTWNVGYPVAEVPSNINVNGGAAKTIGIRGVDSGKQYYWNKDTTEITQDTSEALLASTDVLNITYVGLYDVIVASKNDGQIAVRQTVEGGSGLYEQLENFTNLDGQDLALDKATGLLKKFGRLPNVLRASTDVPGLQAGMFAGANLPELGLSGNWLLESVRISNQGTFLRYDLEAVDGEHLGGWVEFWKKFYESNRQFIARENEVINSLISANDAVSCTDSVSATLTTGATGEWGVDEFGTGEFG